MTRAGRAHYPTINDEIILAQLLFAYLFMLFMFATIWTAAAAPR